MSRHITYTADLFCHNSITKTGSYASFSFPRSCEGAQLVVEDGIGSSSSTKSKAGFSFAMIGKGNSQERGDEQIEV